MAVHHVEEHLNCYNYSRSGGPIEVLELGKGTRLNKETRDTELVCIISGTLRVATQNVEEQTVEARHIVLLPPGTRITAEALSDSYILQYNIRKPVQLCDLCHLEGLAESMPQGAENETGLSILEFNRHTDEYFHAFISCLNEGLKCHYYLELKQQELMFILRGFYTRPELAWFFRRLISNDTAFSEFVMRNYRNVKTVEELASMSKYSRSGFKTHFRKTFGVAASTWLLERKAQNVFHDLNSTNKPLREISEEYNFSSVSHMSIFCKKYFGLPPGKIRRNSGKKSPAGTKFEMPAVERTI
ncbi:MAG: AraC family transcriptional regulator [Rikenellaceae bacterium]|nr:AraC family transcriptional regulator [Rikenellaceae bacterium]MCL2692548.1 AraC family transcriptional regulator [Rikenellaceae bacterium]